MATRGAKVGSWNSKSLTLWNDQTVVLNPDLPEAHQLMGWWGSGGAKQGCLSIEMNITKPQWYL